MCINYLLTYPIPFRSEHRAATTCLQRTRFLLSSLSSDQVLFNCLASAITDLLHVVAGRPLLRFPWGFHSRASLAILVLGFLSVCPIHLHFRCFTTSSIGLISVCDHKSTFEIVSGQCIFKIFRRHLLTNVWSLWVMVDVTFQDSQPKRRIDRILLLNSLNFVFCDILLEFQMFLRDVNASLAFPILILMYSSVPPDSLMQDPR